MIQIEDIQKFITFLGNCWRWCRKYYEQKGLKRLESLIEPDMSKIKI